jgi:hypothetical protein
MRLDLTPRQFGVLVGLLQRAITRKDTTEAVRREIKGLLPVLTASPIGSDANLLEFMAGVEATADPDDG